MSRRRSHTCSDSYCEARLSSKRRPWFTGTTTRLWATTALCFFDAQALVVPASVATIRVKAQGTTWRHFREAHRSKAPQAARPGETWGTRPSPVGCGSSSWTGRPCRRQRGGQWQRRNISGGKSSRLGAGGGARAAGPRGGAWGCIMSVWDHQTPDDWEFEEEVQRLEHKLERAVRREDYDLAAKMRDKLSRYARGCGCGHSRPLQGLSVPGSSQGSVS